jgi:hypothetical protein
MFRLASVFALACIALAAAAFLNTPKMPRQEPQQDNEKVQKELLFRRAVAVALPKAPSFHVRFSVN